MAVPANLLLQDPTLQSALFMNLLSGGALDPRTTSPVAAEAFARGLQMSPGDMNRLQQGLQSQGLEGQLALAGTGQGPAGDVTRQLLALQQGFQAQRFQPRRAGGGREDFTPIPVQPQDVPTLPRVPTAINTKGVPPPKPIETEDLFTEDLGPLRKALSAGRMRESAQATQRSQFRSPTDPTGRALGMGGDVTALQTGSGLAPEVAAAWQQHQGAYNLTTPEQAFGLALADARRSPKSKSSMDLTASLLSKFAQGQALDAQVEALANDPLLSHPDARGFGDSRDRLEQAMQARQMLREQFEKEYREFVGRQPVMQSMKSHFARTALEGSVKTKARRLAQAIGMQGPAGMDAGEAVMAGMTPSEIYDAVRKLDAGMSVTDLLAEAGIQPAPTLARTAGRVSQTWQEKMFANIDADIADSTRRAGLA